MRSASAIRDRFSLDGWLALADLQKTAHRFALTVKPGDDATRAATVLLRKLAGFSGLVHENMYRFAGWRFLEVGRRLERSIQIMQAAAWLLRADARDGAVDMLLEIGDSVMTHRRRYGYSPGNLGAVELLITDPLNPRSVVFQLTELLEQLKALPRGLVEGQLSHCARLALKLQTQLAVIGSETVDPDMLSELAPGPGRRLRPQSPKPISREDTPMLYDVKLTLAYRYDTPVSGGRHHVRAFPRTLPGIQRVVASALRIMPPASEHTEFSDFFGTRVAALTFRASTSISPMTATRQWSTRRSTRRSPCAAASARISRIS